MKTQAGDLTVGELMSREVVTVDETASIRETVALMVGKGIRHLPVLRGGQLWAIISDRDIRMMVTDLVDAEQRRQYLETTPVSRHASHPVTTAEPELPVTEAARIFVESRIGCLPVVDGAGRLIGIVTQTDLLKWLASLSE